MLDFELQRDADSEYNPDRDRKEWLYISFNINQIPKESIIEEIRQTI